jgi:hypothetical protein
MPFALAAVVSLASGCARPVTVAPSGGDRLTGRWVLLNTAVGYHFFKDSVEGVMYPPQAPPPGHFRVERDTLVLKDGTRESRHAFTLRGDTLRMGWPTLSPEYPMTRVQGIASNGLLGSWRMQTKAMITILTFRSDSAMVMEVGIPWPDRRGDTLVFRGERGQVSRTIFYFANGRLNARNLDDRRVSSVALVRRPWGCFGLKELDQNAAECR